MQIRQKRNHADPSNSSGAAYNVESVKRRRTEESSKRDQAQRLEQRKSYIHRAKVLESPLLQLSLEREHGQTPVPDLQRNAARAVVKGWKAEEILCAEAPPRPESTHALNVLDYDPISKTLFTSSTDGMNSALLGYSLHEDEEITSQHMPKFVKDKIRHFASSMSSVSSAHINKESRLLLATWRSPPTGSNVFLTNLLEDGYYDIAQRWRVESVRGYPLDLLASALGPTGSRYSLVIGTSDGLITADRVSAALTIEKFDTEEPNTSDVFAIEFLSYLSPSVMLTGQRSGKVEIFDDRVDDLSSTGTLHHPSAVSHIKQIDGNRIIVAGLHSTLCQYDLRYCVGRPAHHIWSKHNCRAKGYREKVTKTILQYAEHNNQAYTDLGFDVDIEAGLVAAAQSDGSNTVKIFSLHGGQALQTLDATYVGTTFSNLPIKALAFQEDRTGAPKSLWVAKGTKVIRYGW
ncbi:MAG: hypothetical protein M1818_003993 [Claussenomyces sp. TS43310]|nr:MAG: hypothetical protein M1818_003993 [Claussenomyces sp. TS43310]